MNHRLTLGHRDALAATDAVRAELERAERGAAVAVCDDHGELLAFLRTDDCPLPSGEIAVNKAYTASRQRIPSKEVGRQAVEGNYPTFNLGGFRYIGWGGGVPVVRDGVVVGAVGVSGLTEEEDVELAQLGVDAIDEA